MKLRGEDARYVVVPIAGTSTSFAVRTALSRLLWNDSDLTAVQGFLLGLAGWACAVLITYVISRLFVFRSKAPVLKELALYVRNRLGTMFIESTVVALLVRQLQNASLASLLSSAIIIGLNWALTRRLMLRASEPEGR